MRVRELVCAVGTILVVPASGFACSPLTCVEDFKLSAQDLMIPANTPLVAINTFGAYFESFEVVLEKEGDPVEILEQGWYIEPTAGFEENQSYTLKINIKENTSFDDIKICGDSTPEFHFATGNMEPFPTELGSLTSGEIRREPLQINTGDSCSDTLSVVYVDVELDLPEESLVWHGALLIQTYVNDTLWRGSSFYGKIYKPGESWVGFGKDRVYVICDDHFSHVADAPEGIVDIQLRAHIPGTNVALESETISVELRCPDSEPEPEPEPDDSSGSGCSTTHGSGGWLVLGLALVGVRRRRTI